MLFESQGKTIPESAVPKFFSVYAISGAIASGGDLGLSPAVAEKIIKLFGSNVRIENVNPPGVRMTVHLTSFENTEA